MIAQLRRFTISAGLLVALSTAMYAQITTMEGDVKGEDGQPLKGAVIHLTRTDVKGNYKVSSDKKGHWFYTGLPLGTYDITCEVDGKVVDSMKGVHSRYGENTTVNFDARQAKAQSAALAQAAETGTLSKEQARGMSAEEKAKLEKQAKERAEQMKKNKELNDAYNAGVTALEAAPQGADSAAKAAKYNEAITNFAKASELDPTQLAVWEKLGAAYLGLAVVQTGADKTAAYDKAVDTYKKALALPNVDAPTQAGFYNQLGNAYGAEKKIPEATEALSKAAQLDPSMAAKAYFNLGANLVNSGQNDAAAEFFKKSIEADPSYADAHYQYGICLLSKAAVDPKTGKIDPPHGTADEFQKYLQLKPDGPFAQQSKDMLATLGETVQTNYSNPAAPAKKKKP
ncbi:MAG: carboxypeptidase regulatory-like domain-containing protein [Bryobacteraceae bacterium]